MSDKLELEADQLENDIRELNQKYENNELFKDGNVVGPRLARTGKVVGDPEFDRLVKRLEELRPDSEILTEITGSVGQDVAGVAKVTHDPPMASISKAVGKLDKRNAELNKWLVDRLNDLTSNGKVIKLEMAPAVSAGYPFDKVALPHLCAAQYLDGSPVFVISLKRDGVACRAYYENGQLVHAGLRPRNGVTAPDIIEHAKNVMGLPQTLPIPVTCAIGGELEILLSDFQKVNADQLAAGEDEFANPRNAAAGAMNPLGEPKVAKERKVSFVGHSIENLDRAPYKTARDRAMYSNQVLKVKFVRVEPFKYDKLAELEQVVKTLDYETDGVVIEVNVLEDAEQMGRHGGAINGNPKWKLAWKFAEQQAQVVVKALDWQVGRGGRHVAVAMFDDVPLAGTKVRRCTLHNIGFMLRKGIDIGATILIEKSGKIIPKAVDVIKPVAKINYPHNCLSCGSKLVVREGTSEDENGNKIKTQDLVCEAHSTCPAQNVGTLIHYMSSFGVKGVAERDIAAGISSGELKSVADFYTLTPADFERGGLSSRQAVLAYARIHMIERADKEKDDAKLLKQAQKAAQQPKVIPLAQLIASLGIIGASKGTGRELAAHFGTIDKIIAASVADFESVPNVGNTTAEALFDYFRDNKAVIEKLLKHVQPEAPKTGKFSGKTFVFTGTFTEPRDKLQKIVEDLGGKAGSSVGKTTNYVVYGPEAGSKYDKAVELKAKGAPLAILTEADFRKLL